MSSKAVGPDKAVMEKEQQGSSKGGRMGMLKNHVKMGGLGGRVKDLYKTCLNMRSQKTVFF